MRLTLTCSLLAGFLLSSVAGDSGRTLENKAIAWHWRQAAGKLQPVRVDDKLNGTTLNLGDECFQLLLGDGTTLKASDFTLAEDPKLEPLQPEPDSPTVARRPIRMW